VSDEETEHEPTLIERWMKDQQEWQRSVLAYVDAMVQNDDFLVHLGNAMRGSLLAGKPYPMPPAPGVSMPETPADDRLDQVLFALHQIRGQLEDLRMDLDEVRSGAAFAAPRTSAGSASPRPRAARKAGKRKVKE
jgi:hypothetical protein